MSIGLKQDYSDAVRAIRLYEKATKKDLPDVMNRFQRNTAAKTIRFIPMASKNKVSRFDPERKATKRNKAPRLFYALSVRDAKIKKGQGIKKEAIRRFKSRDRSRGFLKALFFKIAADYGASLRGNVKPGGEAAKSRGIKATLQSLRAEMITGLAEPKALKIIDTAFRKGLAASTRDMETYAKKKMEKNSKDYSGRKSDAMKSSRNRA